jgi:actin-related protein 6
MRKASTPILGFNFKKNSSLTGTKKNATKMPVIENSSTFVMDTGGCSVKAGFSNQLSARVIPNCITKAKSEKRRAFIGDQIDDCRDLSSLYYLLPFQRGYLVNWEHQKTVWDYIFGKNCFNVETAAKNVVFTVPYFNFASIEEGLNEILFEEYRCDRK